VEEEDGCLGKRSEELREGFCSKEKEWDAERMDR
jgi:hypothetical protein